jgi:RNA polymerase sigma-70 factor (ECF subfamily)
MAIRLTDIKNHDASYAELDDKMLVLDFQAGQPAAFVEIHRRYGPLARHVCRRFLPNTQDAEEALQETMIRVFQGLFRFNGQFALQPWIARIATNVSLDQIRSRARRPQVDDDSIDEHDREDDSDTPDQLVERLFERDLVLAVLADLPDSHRRALVLRELEGRSHKEIAESMGITPAQAKALIHRAKGSFRRTWLLKVTERGGVIGLAVLPLLWILRAGEGVKRAADRVVHLGQVAQATTPELVATSTTVSAPVTTGLAERAVAAGVTLLVAGGVTVGAVTVTRDRSPEPTPVRAAAAPTTAVEAAQVRAQDEEVADRQPDRERPSELERSERDEDAVPATDEPTDEPAAPDPTPAPVTDPSPSPPPPAEPTPDPSSSSSPDPTTSSPPPVPVAPDFSFAFRTQAEAIAPCDCGGPARLVAAAPVGVLPDVTISQSIEGAALDSAGQAAWSLSLDIEGRATATTGEVSVSFILGAGGEVTQYSGTATLATAAEYKDGEPATYRFSGSYAPVGDVLEGRPAGGGLIVTVGIWPDGTIYTGSVDLS